ncbi:MAG: hypothetical protein WA941_23510 [Nitrososphaeraceae archaeon]
MTLKVVGAFQHGNDLEIKYTYTDDGFINEFTASAERYEDMISKVRHSEKMDNEFQYCLFMGMNSLFSQFRLRGLNDSDVRVIKLDFHLKDKFN